MIMGFSHLEINHLALFLDRHGVDPKAITTVGLPLDQAIRPFKLYIGDVVPTGASSNYTIAFGNCCRCKGTTAAIKGCPPYPFELKRVLEGWSGDPLA